VSGVVFGGEVAPLKKTLELLFGGGAGRRIRRRRKLRPPSKKETRPLPLGMLLSFFVFASSKCVCVCVVLLLLLLVHYNMFLFCFISSYTEKCVCVGCESQRRHWRRDNRPNCLSLNKSGHGAKLFQAKEIKNYLISTLHL
jgi:hypothetical protein